MWEEEEGTVPDEESEDQIVPYFMVAHSPTIWIQKDLNSQGAKNKRRAQMVPFILKGKQRPLTF